MAKKVGEISQRVVQLLGLPISPGESIYLGKSNIAHMKKRHPNDYNLYHDKIPMILGSPDYIRASKDGSIEYVKEFKVNSDYVKIAVRMSGGSTLYVRTMYVLNSNRVVNYIKKGTLLKY